MLTRRSIEARHVGGRFRLWVVGRARPACALAAPPTPAARLAPSPVIVRLPPALGRCLRARQGGVSRSKAFWTFGPEF
jgi:hypothetical protein